MGGTDKLVWGSFLCEVVSTILAKASWLELFSRRLHCD